MSDLSSRIVTGIERIPRGVVALVKSWQGVVILLVVVSQLLLPLHYYVARKDPHDERFAWRMFSPMRMARCAPDFRINEKPVAISTEFHEAWVELAKRGRFVVLEKMGARLCEKNPGAAVHMMMECQYIGRTGTWGGYDMCKVPEI